MERSSLRSPIQLPKNDSANDGGTNGAAEGVSDAALNRGYTKEPGAEAAQDAPPLPFVDEGGFLGRPHGWER